MNSSPERNTFHSQCKIKDAVEEGRDPNTDPDVLDTIEQKRLWDDMIAQREADPEWAKNNLEYDLRNTPWICDKAKASEAYAQNIYAALCNQSWQRNDVWPRLKNEVYSCSWRYAGGIVADMIEKGDYIDWYCSGIRNHATQEELDAMTEEERDQYDWYQQHFVGEGVVTDEIREDFFKLGWIPVDDQELI